MQFLSLILLLGGVAISRPAEPVSTLAGFTTTHEINLGSERFDLRNWNSEKGLPGNSITAIAQTPDGYVWAATPSGLARFDGFNFRLFNHSNSSALRNDDCTSLVVDKHGNLWVGTGDGLIKVSEKSLIRFGTQEGLISNRVDQLLASQDGGIWILTPGGLQKSSEGKLELILTGKTITEQVGSIHSLYEDSSGDLYLSGRKKFGMLRFGSDHVELIEFGNIESANRKLPVVFSSLILGSDEFWLGTEGGVYRGNQSFVKSLYEIDSNSSTGNIWFTRFDRCRNDHVWFYSNFPGLYRFAADLGNEPELIQGTETLEVRCFMEDQEGNFWIGTRFSGLYSLKSHEIRTIGKPDGLFDDTVWSVTEDSEGDIWIATSSNFASLKGPLLTDYVTGPFEWQHRLVRVSYSDRQGRVWLGGSGEEPLLGDGRVGQAGLRLLKGGRLYELEREFDMNYPNDIRCIAETSGGDIWIGAVEGLFRIDRGEVSFLDEPDGGSDFGLFEAEMWQFGLADGLKNSKVISIFEDSRNRIWCGTRSGGMFIFQDGTFTPFTTQDGLSDNNVRTFHEDKDGFLWIGTAGGLTRLKDGHFDVLTENDGLFDHRINHLLEGNNGRFWISCSRGIYRVVRDDLNKAIQGEIGAVHSIVFGQSDGMTTPETVGGNQPAGWKSRDGRLFFPSPKGLIVIDPDRMPAVEHAPPVVIQQVIADGEILLDQYIDLRTAPTSIKGSQTRWGETLSSPDQTSGQTNARQRSNGTEKASKDQRSPSFSPNGIRVSEESQGSTESLPTNKELSGDLKGFANSKSDSKLPPFVRLEPGQGNLIEIKYSANTYNRASGVRFRYRLEGRNEDWNEGLNRRSAFYTDLSPGTYRFQVQAANGDGVWNRKGAVLMLEVAPFFYQTSTFFCLVGLMVAASGWGAHRLRLRRILNLEQLQNEVRLQKERSRISQDMHDDMGANLTRISYMSEAAKSVLPHSGQARSHLENISETSRELVATLGEIIWATNPRNDTLPSLVAYLRGSAATLLEYSSIDCQVDFPRDSPPLRVPAEFRRNLYLILKEALNNVVKHAEASLVRVELKLEESQLELTITDNGNGRCGEPHTTQKVGSGNGLRNMRTRVHELNGSVDIMAQAGKGTRVRLHVPIPNGRGE